MSALDLELERLLYSRGYRESSRSEVPELAALDRGVLGRLAERIARDVLERRHAGCGSLLDAYPATIAAWCGTRLELAYGFLESPAFERHRELPFSGAGIALEHAFFEFAEAAELGDSAVREREFLMAMMRLLVMSPRAVVELPACIRRVDGGFFAVGERGEPALYAALGGRLVHGALTPFLAELLAPGAIPGAIAARHGVTAPVLEQALNRLSALGLVSRLG